jgi:hypothetical protein
MLLSNLCFLEALDPVANAVAKFGKTAINVAKKLNDNRPDLNYEGIAKELLQHVIDADPDPKKKNVGWLLKRISNREIILPEDSHEIHDILTRFVEQKRVGRLPEPDLNKHTLDSLRDMLDQLGEVESKRQGGLGFDPSKMPGVEVYARGGPYIILRSTNPASLAEIGEGSVWCTRKSYGKDNSQAPYYLKRYGAIFTIFKDGKQFVQYTPDYSQIQPARSTAHFRPQKELAKLMAPDPDILSGKITGIGLDINKMMINYAGLTGEPNKKIEHALLTAIMQDDTRISNNIYDAVQYISKFGDPIPFVKEFIDAVQTFYPNQAESALRQLIGHVGGNEVVPDAIVDTIVSTQNGDAAVQLAEISKKRWPQFEKEWLFKDLDHAIDYVAATALVVPGLLDRIIKDGTVAQILKYSLPLYKAGKLDVDALDKVLATKINNQEDVKLICKFAKDVGVTPNIAKRIIDSKHAKFIISYCSSVGEVIPGSDEEILKNGTVGDVWRWMRFRKKYDWPEAERIIARDERFTKLYIKTTGRKPRSSGDERDVTPKTPREALNYAVAIGDEFIEGEPLILQDLDIAITYAESISGPWPELERKLKEEGTPEQKRRYLKNVLYDIPPN